MRLPGIATLLRPTQHTRGRERAILGKPDREISRAIVLARCLVHPVGIGPDAKIAEVKHVVKTSTERFLEREDIFIEPVQGSVNIAGGTDEHDFLVAFPVSVRDGCSLTPGKRRIASVIREMHVTSASRPGSRREDPNRPHDPRKANAGTIRRLPTCRITLKKHWEIPKSELPKHAAFQFGDEGPIAILIRKLPGRSLRDFQYFAGPLSVDLRKPPAATVLLEIIQSVFISIAARPWLPVGFLFQNAPAASVAARSQIDYSLS